MVKRPGRSFVISMMLLCFIVFAVGCSGDKEENKDADRLPAPSGGKGDAAISLRILPRSPRAGQELQVIVKGAARSLSYEWEHNGEEIPGAFSDTLGSIGFKKGDEVVVTVSTGAARASVATVIGNTPPLIKSVTVLPQSPRRGAAVRASAEGEDIDGDFLRFDYQWIINGEESMLNTFSRLNGKEFERGDSISVRVRVSDDAAVGNSYTTPVFVVVNAYPEITSRPPQSFQGWGYSYQVEVEEPDGDSVGFRLLEAPEGMEIDSGGMITWEIRKGSAGNHSVEVEVDDGHGGVDTQRYELNIGI
ncbi:Beta-hexosaminidase [hydrothermal vent metagenome]|uniref:Beta-hexosaminidase n=1 Tax=hydrothermal vent metagenome TaxID=652676 RepID=A0A3B0QRA7_9ZZZZ